MKCKKRTGIRLLTLQFVRHTYTSASAVHI